MMLEGDEGVVASGYGPEVSLLMHFDDGALLTDSSSYNKTVSLAAGTVTADTSDKVFGSASALFAASSYLSVPSDESLRFGSGDFCFDFFVKIPSSGVYVILSKGTGTDIYQIYFNGGNINVYINGAGFTFGSGIAVPYNTWRHIELSKTNNTLYLFNGGVRTSNAPTHIGAVNGGTNNLLLGKDQATTYYPNCKLEELHIQKGTFGHTANFTPPIAPY